jgi:outer membrane protein TolC
VATAELYPKFTLMGSIGVEALSVNRLVSTPTRSYSFGPSISWPIFKGGAIRANIEVQSALQEGALWSTRRPSSARWKRWRMC